MIIWFSPLVTILSYSTTWKLRVVFYAADKAEDLSWGHSLLDALRDCSKETKEEPGYVGVLQQRPGAAVFDSGRPHRRQPTRFPCPWDSPGKNTGVGCHFLLQCSEKWKVKVKSESEVAQSCPTLSDPMDCSLPGSSIHGIFQARVLEWGAISFSKGQVVRTLK